MFHLSDDNSPALDNTPQGTSFGPSLLPPPSPSVPGTSAWPATSSSGLLPPFSHSGGLLSTPTQQGPHTPTQSPSNHGSTARSTPKDDENTAPDASPLAHSYSGLAAITRWDFERIGLDPLGLLDLLRRSIASMRVKGAPKEEIIELETFKNDLQKNRIIPDNVSISRTQLSHLEKLSVDPNASVISATQLYQRLLEPLQENEDYRNELDARRKAVFAQYKELYPHLNRQTESAGRDYVAIVYRNMLALLAAVKTVDLLKGHNFACPEVLLSSSQDETIIKAPSGADKKVSLNGRVDCAFFGLPDWETLEDNDRTNLERHFKNLKYVSSDKGIIDASIASQMINLTVIEVKQYAFGGDELLDWIPQVLAEAWVLSIRYRPSSQGAFVPFVLTTGFDWIFGFIYKPTSALWKYFRTEPFKIPELGLSASNSVSESEREETMTALKVVLELLVHWVSRDRQDIMGIGESLAGHSQ
ncbi:hypothetical protein FRB90_003814 [Tulasnella sp. 427]|nr:hypothetical protein FRB90_003814 [Tulasnella sp. 427]